MSLRPTLLALGLLGVVALSACGSSTSSSSSSGAGTVDLVAYSTPKPAYDQLIKAFNATPAGKGVGFTSSYGASGDQAAVGRSPASTPATSAFSLQTDMDKLVKAGKVASTWNSGPTKGFVTDSVVVFVVRKGNPKNIHTWADLVKPGVKVVTPNPFSSGSARWNILAGYGQVLKSGGTTGPGRGLPEQALRQHRHAAGQRPRRHRRPSPAAPATCCSPTRTRPSSPGRRARPVDYVVPDTTILIQNPAAVTVGSPAAASSFLDLRAEHPGPDDLRPERLPARGPRHQGDRAGRQRPGEPVPDPGPRVHHRRARRVEGVTTTFFDTKTGVITAIEQQKGVPIDKK